MTRLANPTPIFLDGRGNLLDGGTIFIGATGTNPETAANQLAVYWDFARTVPAAQPLRTLGGVIVRGANPSNVYLAETDYSTTIRDANGLLVTFSTTANDTTSGAAYQPLDVDLTAIATLTTTTFGRNLLTLADTNALKSATGIPAALPLTGGTVSGAIVRSGAGVYSYALNSSMTGYRLCGVNPVGTADATSQPGDWQAFY